MLPNEPADQEINTPYAVYGNAIANNCLEALNVGHVLRLIIDSSTPASSKPPTTSSPDDTPPARST